FLNPYPHRITPAVHISQNFGTRYILNNKKGRGDAVRIGIKEAKNDILVFFDADGSHEPKDIPKLLQPLRKGEADLVIGSRRTGGSLDVTINFTGIIRAAGCDFITMIINHRWKTNLTDVLYSFRAIKREVARDLNLRANDFDIEQEMVIECLKKEYRIKEIPSREYARAWGRSKLATYKGLKLLWHLFLKLF
ncbi:glycosyltransferase, partial [bacterium]|nr:glycosyltransferase [bacterium]